MFNPNAVAKNKAEKAAKIAAANDLKNACLQQYIPPDLQDGLIFDIKEVVCGDPSCAPIDTVFSLVWPSGGKGIFALPLAIAEIRNEDLEDHFPDLETLTKWKNGQKAKWPPAPKGRFTVGTRVECRIGPHPVKGWAPGRIVRLQYREANWPPNMIAPYQILLHDGRLIFAPQDTDQVIRLRPPPAPDAPSSPEINYEEFAGGDEDMAGEDEDEQGYADEGDDMDEYSDDQENDDGRVMAEEGHRRGEAEANNLGAGSSSGSRAK